MKKSDFKIDFSKRDVISMVCFTVVMILVLILGNTFGYVSASSTYEYCLNYTDYVTSSSYNSNIVTNTWFFGAHDNFSKTLYENIDSLDASSINGDSAKYYAIGYGNNYGGELSLYLFTDIPYYISRSDARYIYTRGDIYRYRINFITNGTEWWDFTLDTTQYVLNPVENGALKAYDFGGIPIAYCNFELFAPLNGWESLGYGDAFTAFVRSYVQNDDSTYFTNYNYILGDDGGVKGINGLDNLENIIDEDESVENSSNNLYLNNPYWSFNLPRADKLTSTNGTVTFNAVPTDYQLEHSNQFNLHYWFQIDITYSYSDSGDGGFSGGGHGFCILNSVQPTKSLGTSTTRSRTGIFKYRYNGSDYATSPFSDFDGSQTFQTITVGTGWNKIFRQCYLSGNTSYNTFYDWWSEYGNGGSSSGVKPTITDAKLKCYAQLYDSSSSSGVCAYYYDFLTGESGVLDNSMSVNSNPFDFDTQDQYSNESSGYGYVVQNNNQTVNINNNVSNDVQNEISNIIGSTDDSESSSWVNTLMTILSTNAFLAFMSETFGFIPSAFWTAISTFFITCLSFLVGFCLLRLLFDLI